MATSKIQILIEADDKASAKLKALAAGMEEVDNKSKKTNTTWANMKTAGLQVASVIGAVAAAAYGVKKALEATVFAAVDYNKAILDSARATGISTDEMSRLVQVADDFGVSQGELTSALQLATKNGFAPSVASLASLADRVNAIQSPTQRAAELAKILGRNWAALDPILQQGGVSIRAMAAAVEEGLVATEAEVAETERLRLEVDKLNDSWQATKLQLGASLAPALTTEFSVINEQLAGHITWLDAWQIRLGLVTLGQLEASRITQEQAFAIRDLDRAIIGVNTSAQNVVSAYQAMTEAQLVAAAAEAMLAGNVALANHLIGLAQQARNAEGAFEAMRKAIEQAVAASSRLHEQRVTGRGGFQQGGSFVVPGTGGGDRPFLLGLEPGERVDVTPRSQVSNVNNSRTMNIGDVNINTDMDLSRFRYILNRALGA